MTTDTDDFLSHYGVKGMKWGVRKEDVLVGRNSAKLQEDLIKQKNYSKDVKRIHAELKNRGHTDLNSALLKAKYETPAGEEPTKGLSRNQKIAIGVGVGVVGVAALGFAAYKGGLFDRESPVSELISDKFDRDTLIKRYAENPSSGSLFETRNRAYDIAGDGLKMNWNNEVRLPSGSIIKRVSSKAETVVREDGFFGSFRDEDVKSYSAILPSFWTKWRVGVPMDGGFINHYQASAEVRAPSGETTFGIFKDLISSSSTFRESMGIRDAAHLATFTDDDLSDYLKDHAMGWVSSTASSSKEFFEAVKSKGFNALIDFNDAGILGKTPLRVIDSSIFSIVKNETLSFEDMTKAASEWVPSLIHYFMEGTTMSDNVDEFLAHYGVPGMKWGKRKAEYKAMSKADRKAQKTSEIEAARLRGAKGQNFKNYSKASANVKAAKKELKAAKKIEGPEQIAKKEAGLAKAKSILKSVKQQNQSDYMNGTAAKNGKELVTVMLLGDLGRSINVMNDQKRLLANS